MESVLCCAAHFLENDDETDEDDNVEELSVEGAGIDPVAAPRVTALREEECSS